MFVPAVRFDQVNGISFVCFLFLQRLLSETCCLLSLVLLLVFFSSLFLGGLGLGLYIPQEQNGAQAAEEKE